MSSEYFVVRITQVYQYAPDNVQLGAVFVNTDLNSGRIVILTTQNKLNVEPKIGQQWQIKKERNYSIRQERTNTGSCIDVWRFMEPELKCVLPDNGKGFVTFLSSDKAFLGIGKIKAQLLWDEFRSDLFNMLECDMSTPYIKDNSITNYQAIKSVLKRDDTVLALYKGFKEYIYLKFANQLVAWEIEAPVQKQLFRLVGNDVINVIKENPYKAFSLGMRFEKVDEIAQRYFDVKLNDEIRLAAIVEQSLRIWNDKGHTFACWSDLEPIIRKYLPFNNSLLLNVKNIEGNKIGFVKQHEKYFLAGNFILEKTIAKRISKIAKDRSFWDKQLEEVFRSSIPFNWRLEEAQERAVRTALISKVFVLTGGAGTGKTATTRQIVNAYQKLGFKIYPAALSGKAVRRLQQSIGIKAHTIAKLLNDSSTKPDNSLLLIDEASMLDASTMWRLVTAFSAKARIILVGDPYQLPPINAGLILSDFVKSGIVNHVELEVVKRQGAHSSLPEYANSIRKGNVPNSINTKEITFQQVSNDVLENVVRIFDLYSDVLVVAATNEMVTKVNIELQSKLNPQGQTLTYPEALTVDSKYELKEGDPIAFTRTCYKNDIQNGTLGKIVSISSNSDYPCIIETEDLDTNGSSRKIKVDWQLLESIELGYCLTLHKLQGSQVQNIIILLERCRLLDRSWLYTAITRAEENAHIVGDIEDYELAVHKQSASEVRKTALVEMLKSG